MVPPKWHEEAEKRVGKDDEILRSYEGALDGTYGFLTISKERVMFVTEKGLFRKTVDFLLDLPFSEVSKINHKGDRVFEFVDKSGKHHDFETNLIGVSTIEDFLKERIE